MDKNYETLAKNIYGDKQVDFDLAMGEFLELASAVLPMGDPEDDEVFGDVKVDEITQDILAKWQDEIQSGDQFSGLCLVLTYVKLFEHFAKSGNCNGAVLSIVRAVKAAFETRKHIDDGFFTLYFSGAQQRVAAKKRSDKHFASLRKEVLELLSKEISSGVVYESPHVLLDSIEKDLAEFNKSNGGVVRQDRIIKNIRKWLNENIDGFREEFESISGLEWSKPPRKTRSR